MLTPPNGSDMTGLLKSGSTWREWALTSAGNVRYRQSEDSGSTWATTKYFMDQSRDLFRVATKDVTIGSTAAGSHANGSAYMP